MEDRVHTCMARLKGLAQAETGDPRTAAAQVVREFLAQAGADDRAKLKTAVEDARIVGLNTTVAPPFLPEHDRWMAALDGARAATLPA
ncbi:MAG TPA: hypothetical protein VG651_00330 [Stellaceae bacterium]|nr:hypothetical protein [Stellaceae bacterium]